MDINDIVKRYAAGEVNRKDLKGIFEGIGFSATVTDILLRKADYSKARYENDEANNIDPSKFQVAYSDCVPSSRAPSGSLGDG